MLCALLFYPNHRRDRVVAVFFRVAWVTENNGAGRPSERHKTAYAPRRVLWRNCQGLINWHFVTNPRIPTSHKETYADRQPEKVRPRRKYQETPKETINESMNRR